MAVENRPAEVPAVAKVRARDVVADPLAFGRETVESIVIAFTLALLFRAFEAEAFVIPTGSMAPALMGRHKDLVCGSCGLDYRVGCSAEEDDQSQSFREQLAIKTAELERAKGVAADERAGPDERARAQRTIESLQSPHGQLAQLRTRLAGKLVAASRCPNCGHVMDLLADTPRGTEYDPRYPSFNGDRILVNKFVYDFTEPRRFDVVVFRYPEDAKTNYIKRLIGLPGETVSIAGGDIWTSRDGAEPAIARKPDAKLTAMLQCVHDSRHEAEELARAGWPARWSDWSAAGAEPRFRSDDGGRSFAVTAAGGPATLRYRHFMPAPDDWDAIQGGERVDGELTPTLVDDFQPYNALPTRSHWVGDLALEARLESRGTGGRVTLDLVEGGRRHEVRIDLATGDAELSGPFLDGTPRAATGVRGRGAWTVRFANVDDELTLFVDGRRVPFDRPSAWATPIGAAAASRPVLDVPVPGAAAASDLAPAGITVDGAEVGVSALRLLRDIYYIGAHDISAMGGMIEKPRLDFPLEPDQFFVLGDNSAASKDSRLWLEGHHVDRHLIVGKALTIFWPHAVSPSWAVPVRFRIAGNPIELRLPSWPNFGRMGPVR